jgi:hypothetical protein
VDWTLFTRIVGTATVGLAGIVATFFAPARTQRAIERRREAREFRQAVRLVHAELYFAEGILRLIVSGYAEDEEDLPSFDSIAVNERAFTETSSPPPLRGTSGATFLWPTS